MTRALGRVFCRAGRHGWRYSPGGWRRACVWCGRREVHAGLSPEVWAEHTYPLDADPREDPTPCVDAFGDPSTVGFETLWAEHLRGFARRK